MRRLTGLTYRLDPLSPIMVASHDADRQIIGWGRSTSPPAWREAFAFEVAQMPVDLGQQFFALKPRIDVHNAGIPNLRELSFDSKKSPGFLKGRGLSLTTVRHLKSPASPSPQPCAMLFGSAAFGPRGFALPSQIFRLPSRTVANSYPNVDLLWDNVIAGLPSWPRNGASASPGPSLPDAAGRDPYDLPSG